MNKKLLIFGMSLWIATFMSSCITTSYRSYGLTGGYKEIKESEGVYRVRFDGNVYTSDKAVSQFLIRRCAEITLENGKRYFDLLSFEMDELDGVFVGMGTPFGKAKFKVLESMQEGKKVKDAVKVMEETSAEADGKMTAKAAETLKMLEGGDSQMESHY
ncbi:MAG: hypothetical protein MRZ79_13235 [Bacteroidia bacterium]|nr:hypothetical protein [Bacteroidia bacterium]